MVIHSQMRLLSFAFLRQMFQTEDNNICCLMVSVYWILKIQIWNESMLIHSCWKTIVQSKSETKETSHIDHQIMLQRKSEWVESLGAGRGINPQSTNTHLKRAPKIEMVFKTIITTSMVTIDCNIFSHRYPTLEIPTLQTFSVKTSIFALSYFQFPTTSDFSTFAQIRFVFCFRSPTNLNTT